MQFFDFASAADRRRWWRLAIAGTALLASCDSPFEPEIEDVTRLDVSPAVLSLVAGGNATLTARVYGVGDVLLPTAKVFWSSQDASVVTVAQNGVATAVAEGTTQIAASAGGQSRTIAVTVSQRPIALVRISPPAGNVAVGGTLSLQGEALDGTGELLPNRVFEWSSSAPAVATVSATGVVTGVSLGQATISATGEGKTGTALITVSPSLIASIAISPNGGNLPAGGTLLFVATPRDAGGQVLTGRTLEWRSSNDAVATISASGLLTAISPGSVTITVSAPGGGPGGTTPSASVDVTVLIEPVASAILVPAIANVQVGGTVLLRVNLFNAGGNPLSTAGRTITYSSSNAPIATVNSSGTVTGVAVGNVTITATITTPSQPGVIVATAQVTVSNQPVASVVVTPSPATVHVGYSRQFTAVPLNAAGQPLLGRTVIWTSTDQSVVTVDQAGTVTGVGLGTAEIRATSEGIQGVSPVTVDLVAVSSVLVAPPTATLMPGSTVQLTATPRDSAGTPLAGPALGARTTTWTSLNTAVATVSISGLVTAVAQGSATIQATIGGTNGTSSVTVNPLPSASQLAVTTQPSSTAQNDAAFAVQPVVQLRDVNGNNVSTAGVIIQAAITAPGSGTLGGTATATTNASGAATFSNLKITGLTGTRTLTFTSGTLTSAVSGAINVQAGAPTQLVITTQPPSTANSGQVFSSPTVVQLRDVSGNAVPEAGVTINAAPSPSAGVTLGGGSVATSASGAATFSALTLTGPAASYTLAFSSGSLTPATSTAIVLGAGSGSRLSITTQPSATAQNGVTFAQQPVIQLRDASNNPVTQSGVVVTVAILTGGGTLGGSTTATTNASGVATFSGLSITGTVGAKTLLFGASGYTTVTSNAITITPGAATALSITTQPSGTAQSGQPFASPPVIQLRDQSGNAVSQGGVVVSGSVNGAGASLIGSATATTTAAGVATFSGLGLAGTVGSYSLSFAAGALTGVTSSSISLAAGAPAQLTITTQPAGATSGSAFTTQPVVQVRDAQGNAVSQGGITVTPSIASGGGGSATLLGGAASTNASGVATFSGLGISGPVGNYTIGFAAAGLTGATSATIALASGAPAQLVIVTQPAGANSGAAFTTQPVIAVRDAQSNPVNQAGISVTASVNQGGASLIGASNALTNASGVATFSSLGLSGTAGTYTLTFASSGLPNVTSASITLNPGAAAQLAMVTQPSASVASGATLAQQPAVRLRDAAGNNLTVNGVVINVSIPAGASLTGSTSATTTSGIATFAGLGISGTVGSYSLSFSSSGVTGITSSAISVTAGAVAQMTIASQPGGATSGSAFTAQPAVQLRDGAGNAVAQSGTAITAAIATGPAGATLLGTGSATTNASGLATFSGLGLSGTVGNYTIRFSSTGLPNVTSGNVALTPGAPSQLTVQTQPAGAVNGAALTTQPAVLVRDAQGNAVGAGVSVTASLNGAGATLFGSTSALTNASGVATFSGLGLSGTTGSYSLTFASGSPNVTSSTFALAAGAASRLVISTPPSSSVASGSAFATPPAVQLQDAGNNPVSQAGVNVTVAISPAGATLSGATTVATNASGTATFTGLGASGTAGNYTLQFSSPGLTGTSSGTSVTAGAAVVLVMATQPPASAVSGVAFSTAPTVQLRDASGNNVSQTGVSITAAVTGGGASLVGTPSASTNSSGVATFTGLGISGGGTFTISFSSGALTGVTSTSVVVTESATKLGMVTQPSTTAQNGQAFAIQPSVRLLSATNNPVSQAGITITAEITGGGATLFGTASASTNASGIATFTNLGITGTVGSYTLTFRSTGLTEVASGSITLTPGAATKLVITNQPPGSVIQGTTFTVVVRLADAQNNFVSAAGVSVSATLNGTPGTLNGTTTVVTSGTGTSTFGDLSITGSSAGSSHSISFAATGLTGVTSSTISIFLFDMVSAPEGVFQGKRDDMTGLDVPLSGTKAVAAHTPGLAKFSFGSNGALAGTARETNSR